MRYLAVDDERYALEDLEEAVRAVENDCELHSFVSAEQALLFASKTPIDVAFLDIEMGSANGLVLAKQLKDICPKAHIIFVTGYEQYAVSAFRIHATGYLLKPVTEEAIRRELTFIYSDEAESASKRVRVQTFGGFDVFVDGKPLLFKRAKAKELLAYLVDRRGVSVTNDEICVTLWEDDGSVQTRKSYVRTLLAELRSVLKEAGIENILEKNINRLAIVPDKLDCDFYRFLEGDPVAVNSYRYDYLPSYAWAEFSVGVLDKRLDY